MGNRVGGKIALVTGAGSVGTGIGNGKAAALVYAREGAKVVVSDLNLGAAEETQSIIEKEGGDCIVIQADVSNSADCANLVSKTIQHYGRIDILHNNVGIEIPGGIQEISEDDWDKTLSVNMQKQRSGVIVNISSINGIRTLPALSGPYGASKAGMIALTREIAVEYASDGIRANCVLPGMMNTPFVKAALTEAWGGDIQEMINLRDAMCPTGKQGESWDVANAALFLASDESKYVTGTTLVVDGALTSSVKTN
jgi:NAD(P)-dependent dehydrogenase (short-subunit alcohol dehydrogenase family)